MLVSTRQPVAAAPGENVLAHDVLQKRGLSGAGLADDSYMVSSVALAKTEGPDVASRDRSPELCDCLIFVLRGHPPSVVPELLAVAEGDLARLGRLPVGRPPRSGAGEVGGRSWRRPGRTCRGLFGQARDVFKFDDAASIK